MRVGWLATGFAVPLRALNASRGTPLYSIGAGERPSPRQLPVLSGDQGLRCLAVLAQREHLRLPGGGW